MSTLAIVGIDVILLIVLLMLSVPLPYCFGGALMFMALAGNVSMKSMMLWGYSQSIGYGSSCKSAFHHRWNLYGRQWCCKETA